MKLQDFEEYRENNRLEAKKALGGLPESLWETVSAFANTRGGVIFLGVEEYPDHSLHPIDLPDPQRLVDEFWQIIQDPRRFSSCILKKKDVQIIELEGKHIVRIFVPHASRLQRPVYMGTDPFSGSYRRNGEGDYRMSPDEVKQWLKQQTKEDER